MIIIDDCQSSAEEIKKCFPEGEGNPFNHVQILINE